MMTEVLKRGRIAGLAICVAVLGGSASWAQGFTPYAATYAVEMRTTAAGTPYQGGVGTLRHRWADGCAVWAVDQRFDLTVAYADGSVSDLTAALSSEEAKDGTRIEVRYTGTTDGIADEVRAADAMRPFPGAPGQARTGRLDPDGGWDPNEWDLPAEAMLPTQHTLALLAAAAGGRTTLTVPVFQGQDHRPLFEVSAQIDPAIEGSWPITLRFARVEDRRDWHLYTVTGRLRPDGVITSLVYDYGDYHLVAQLTTFERLPVCTP